MKRIFLMSCLLSFLSFAQTEPVVTMFWNNYSLFNPANTGVNFTQFGSVVYRNQWDGVENAPNTLTGLYNTKIDKINSGVGIGYMYNIVGYQTGNRLYFNYAYHFNFENSQLSIGTALVVNRIESYGLWNGPQTGTTPGADPNLPKDYQTKLNFSLGFYYTVNRLQFGLSSTQINEPFYDKINLTNTRNYFGFVRYDFELSSNLDLKTILNVKADQVAAVADLYTLFTLKKKYWAGLVIGLPSNTTSNNVGLQLGVDIKNKFRVGYGYRKIIDGPLAQFDKGTHEIVFAYLLK